MLPVILVLTVLAHTSLPVEWSVLVGRLAKAAPLSDASELKSLRTELKRVDIDSLAGRDQALVQYTLGYTDRVLAFAPGTSIEERKALLAESMSELEQVVVLDPKNAEAHALLGSVYGASIAVNPDRTIELSQKGRKALAKALELAPANPRVQFLNGSSAFHRPPEYGGGPEVAEPYFRRAVEIFSQEPKSKPWPNWGRFEAYLYLGQTLARLQKRDEARRAYEAALAIVPGSDYVRSVLIPRLNR